MNFSQLLWAGAVVLGLVAIWPICQGLQARATERWRASMEALFWFADPTLMFRWHLLLGVLLPLLAWLATGHGALALAAVLAAAVLPRWVQAALRSRRRQRLMAQLPDAMSLLSGALRAGTSLQGALSLMVRESPDPLAQEFSLVLREQRLGMGLEDSLDGLRQRLAVEGIDLFVSALTIAREVGGNLAEILDRLSASLRTQATLEGKVQALTAQGKMQGWVVGLLPVVLGGVLSLLDPEAMQPLFDTPSGWGVMAVVAVLLALGGVFIRRIVRIDL